MDASASQTQPAGEDLNDPRKDQGSENGRIFRNVDGSLRFAQLLISACGFVTMESMNTCNALSGVFGFFGFVSLLSINTVLLICAFSLCSLHHFCPVINVPLTLLFHDGALSVVNLLVCILFVCTLGYCGQHTYTDVVLLVFSAIGIALFFFSAIVDYKLMKKDDYVATKKEVKDPTT